ncbi:MAG: GntR family transcriptional regulator [Myxococcaceae bacterium]
MAAEIRILVLQLQSAGAALPSERSLAERYRANRTTVRLALERLRSEGLVISHPGVRWRLADPQRDAAFASFDGFIEAVGKHLRPAHVRELIEFRRREFSGAVDSRLVEGASVSPQARRLFEGLRHLSRADSVLTAEDELMTELMIGTGRVIEALAAHQIRRALVNVRTHLDLKFGLSANVPGFMRLLAAWDVGDRAETLLLADRVATEREALYVRLSTNAAVASPHKEPPTERLSA